MRWVWTSVVLVASWASAAPWEAYNTQPSVVARCNGFTDDAASFASALQSGKHLIVPSGVCVVSSFSAHKSSTLELGPGAILKPTGAVTISGLVLAPARQWIDLSLGGTVSLTGSIVGNVYPQWWGAVGDGVADDTAEIDLAFKAACTSSRSVFFVPGTYGVSTNSRIGCNNFTISGSGPNASILKQLTSWANIGIRVAGILELNHSDNGANGNSVPIENITIENLGFRGTGNTHYLPAQGNTGDPKAITSNSANNVTIQSNRFENFGREIIWPSGPIQSRHWNINDNYFHRLAETTENPGSNIEVSLNHSTVSNNKFFEGYIGIGIGGSYNSVTNNLILNPTLVGIGFGDAEGGQFNSVTGNIIQMVTSTIHYPVYGVAFGTVSKYNTLVGNTISITQVPGGGGTKAIAAGCLSGTNRVSDNMIVLDMAGHDAGMSGINIELNVDGKSSVDIANNSIVFLNENTTATRMAISCTTGHAAAELTCSLSNNRVSGMTDVNDGSDGFAFYANQNGGKVSISAQGDTTTGGRGGFKNFVWSDGELDNTPIHVYTLSDGGVVAGPY